MSNHAGNGRDVLDELITGVRAKEFDQAQKSAWVSAAHTGRPSQAQLSEAAGQQLFDVTDDMAEQIWDVDAPEQARVALLVSCTGACPARRCFL